VGPRTYITLGIHPQHPFPLRAGPDVWVKGHPPASKFGQRRIIGQAYERMKHNDNELQLGVYDYDVADLEKFLKKYPTKIFGELLKQVQERIQAEGWIHKREGERVRQ
jgi:hypothetical protein